METTETVETDEKTDPVAEAITKANEMVGEAIAYWKDGRKRSARSALLDARDALTRASRKAREARDE